MENKEFNLSEKVLIHSNEDMNDTIEFIEVQDVKEFIKKLKEELKEVAENNDWEDVGIQDSISEDDESYRTIPAIEYIDMIIDKLAGKDLVEKSKGTGGKDD